LTKLDLAERFGAVGDRARSRAPKRQFDGFPYHVAVFPKLDLTEPVGVVRDCVGSRAPKAQVEDHTPDVAAFPFLLPA
jgi:hypothetical protein